MKIEKQEIATVLFIFSWILKQNHEFTSDVSYVPIKDASEKESKS
jgi:hypothetical protein